MRRYADALDRLNEGERGPYDPSDGLTLEEAEAVALLFNPDVRVARLEARVPLLGARHAGVPDDPRIELDLLRVLRSVAEPWILASGLGFTVPLSGRLGHERDQAFAQAGEAIRTASVAEWSLVVRLRDAWNAWSATGERIVLVEEHLKSVAKILEIARAQRAADQIGTPQVRVLELEEVTRTGELEVLRARHEREGLGLRALMGLVPDADVTLVPQFSADPAYSDTAAEERRLRQANLELALAKAKFMTADRTLRLEASKRFPDLEVGPLFESEDGIERLGAGVGIALPLWNRNRRAIAEACAARRAAHAAYQARYQDLVVRLARSRSEVETARKRSTWLRERVAPMADVQLEDLRRLGEIGDMDVLILKEALSSVLETKLQLLDARVERALASNRWRALVEPIRTPATHW